MALWQCFRYIAFKSRRTAKDLPIHFRQGSITSIGTINTTVHSPQASGLVAPAFGGASGLSPGDNSLYNLRPQGLKSLHGASGYENGRDEAIHRSCASLLAPHNGVLDAGKYIVATNDMKHRINYGQRTRFLFSLQTICRRRRSCSW